MNKYLAELQRRNVFRAVAAFVVFGWILLQAATTLEDVLGLPDWFDSVAAAILVLGFPAVVIFSWVYERTPEGLKKTADIPDGQSITSDTGRKLNYVTMLAVAVLIAVILGDRCIARDSIESADEEVPATDAAIAALPVDDDKSIAVLPFKNLSDSDENEYFSDGVMEAILNDLARLRDVKVVSRTSVEAYRDTEKSVRLIGQELDVAHILEGSVQRAGDRVRVTAQLIQTSDDKHLWSSNYDRDISDIFKIQSEIATAISRNLELILTSEEKELMSNAPTSNLEAYDLYLRAQHRKHGEWWKESTEQQARDTLQLCNQAVELDPEFALAYVCIAERLLELGRAEYLPVNAWREPAFEHIDRALSLKPKLWEAFAAQCDIYFSMGDFTSAYYAAEKVLQLYPNHPVFLQVASYERLSFDQYEDAVDLALKSLSLIPNGDYPEYSGLIFGTLVWLDADLFQHFVDNFRPADGSRTLYEFMIGGAALIQNDYQAYLDRMVAVYDRTPSPNNKSNIGLAYSHMGDFEKSRRIYEDIISSSESSDNVFLKYPFDHRLANALIKTGETERGYALLESTRDALLESESSGELIYGNKGLYYDLALIYTTLEDHDEAMRWLRMAEANAKDGAFFDLVFIYGDTMLDPLREHPDFKAMIQEIEAEQVVITKIFRGKLAEHQEKGRLLWLTAEQ